MSDNLSVQKWFGVRRTSSFGSIDWLVNRLELIKASAPVKAIISSSSLLSPKWRRSIFWPPLSWLRALIQGEAQRRIEIPFDTLVCGRSLNFGVVTFLGELAQFLVGSDKGPSFVRDELLRSPLRLPTRKKALRRESVSSLYATSRCTVLDN